MFTLTLIALLLLFGFLFETITGSSSGLVANVCIFTAIGFMVFLIIYTAITYVVKKTALNKINVSRLPSSFVAIYICILTTFAFVGTAATSTQSAKQVDSAYQFFTLIAIILLVLLVISYWVFLFVFIKKYKSSFFLVLPMLVAQEFKGFALSLPYGIIVAAIYGVIF